MDGAGGRQRPEPACMQQSEQCQAAAGRVVVWWWQRELRARGTALARGKTALALASMEKQLFLALAYFVRKRLAKRLLLAF